MKYLFLLLSFSIFGQKIPQDFGYKNLKFNYKKEVVEIILKSKNNEENIKKPLFFWCQGSLPQPVIKYNDNGIYSVVPFDENDFLENYHLVIVGKPGIPIIADVKNLKGTYSILNDSLQVPKEYSERNYLDYYVKRNNYIIKKLQQEKWVSSEKLVVAGHSEGSTIAAKMAYENKSISHLIYSGGNPYGRFLNILAESIYKEKNYDVLDYWREIVANQSDASYNGGDTYKTTYDFSTPMAEYLLKLKIPILINYGTKDWNAKYNDLFYVESIRKKLQSITIKPYLDLDHNYFPVNDKLEPNYEIYNWEIVGKEWSNWLKNN